MQMKRENFVVYLGKQTRFEILINNTIVESGLLPVENMVNRHIRSVPLVKRFSL